jgi:hypothetical protein
MAQCPGGKRLTVMAEGDNHVARLEILLAVKWLRRHGEELSIIYEL